MFLAYHQVENHDTSVGVAIFAMCLQQNLYSSNSLFECTLVPTSGFANKTEQFHEL